MNTATASDRALDEGSVDLLPAPSESGTATALRHRSGVENILLGPLLAGLDLAGCGLALFDDDARLVYLNASARSTFARLGWSVVDMGLRSNRGRDHDALLQAVRKSCLRGQRHLIELLFGTLTHFAAVIPIASGDRRWAVVTLGREELCGALELQMFASHHGLTYSENEVLRKLSSGLRAADIATARGVALSTVLTQISSLRSKTLAASVRELLCMVSRLPPLRPMAGLTAASSITAQA